MALALGPCCGGAVQPGGDRWGVEWWWLARGVVPNPADGWELFAYYAYLSCDKGKVTAEGSGGGWQEARCPDLQIDMWVLHAFVSCHPSCK